MRIDITAMQVEDWHSVQAIYLEGIATGNATFETEPPDWMTWNAQHLAVGLLVARCGDKIIGWAALSAVSDRCVYSGVAEVSVYVATRWQGQGVGKALLRALIEESEAEGIWTLQAGIFPENKASIALHKACGFRLVGIRKSLGQLHGIWRNVVLLERRSMVAGS